MSCMTPTFGPKSGRQVPKHEHLHMKQDVWFDLGSLQVRFGCFGKLGSTVNTDRADNSLRQAKCLHATCRCSMPVCVRQAFAVRLI